MTRADHRKPELLDIGLQATFDLFRYQGIVAEQPETSKVQHYLAWVRHKIGAAPDHELTLSEVTNTPPNGTTQPWVRENRHGVPKVSGILATADKFQNFACRVGMLLDEERN